MTFKQYYGRRAQTPTLVWAKIRQTWRARRRQPAGPWHQRCGQIVCRTRRVGPSRRRTLPPRRRVTTSLSLLPSARTTRDTYTLNCASPALLLPPFPPRHLPPLHKVARKQCLKQVGLQGVPKIAPRISNLLHYIQQVAAPCSGTHDEVCYSSKHESESWYCLSLFSTCMSVCLSVRPSVCLCASTNQKVVLN